MLSFTGNGMHQNVNSDYYKIYPRHLREQMLLIDELYLIVERLELANKLPEYEISDFPISCEMLEELWKK